MPVVTYEKVHHDIDTDTGFCKKCGNHWEMLAYDGVLCVYAENSVAISHLRARQILEKRLSNVAVELETVT